MEAHLDLSVRDVELEKTQKEKKGIRHQIGKVRKGISKYVAYDKDGLFKDPNWPHLWS